MTFKTGLHPVDPEKNARFKTALNYGFVYPTPTYPIDRTEGITDWGIMGNDQYGDCGVAAVPGHADMLSAVLVGEPLADNTMTTEEIVSLYFQYTGGQDVGVDLGDYLLWLFNQNIIEGFVKIGLDHLDEALATFNVIVVGASLNPGAQQQFANGEPWNVGPTDSPDPMEGHAILYLKAESPDGPNAWCTWGKTQPSTGAWKSACPQQAFAVITEQEAHAVGFPYAELIADLQALGGTVDPTPEPVPTPTPTPAPPAAPEGAWEWLTDLVNWLKSHA
jgi:hypothetical protein